jgi:hypothetical protein
MPRDLMDVSGAWTMTFGAAAACRATLPAIARDLTYRVQIQQHGTRLDIEVSSVTGTLAGRVRNQSLTISMAGDYGLYVALTPTRSLGIEGLVNAELAGNEFRGTLDGQFIVYGGGMPSVTCRDSAHSFLLHRE